MAAPIGPGDWVECVQNRTPTTAPPIGLVVGRIYRVTAAGVTHPDDINPNVPFIAVAGARIRPGYQGFRASWFKPIPYARGDFIESLKAPPISAPQRITEAA